MDAILNSNGVAVAVGVFDGVHRGHQRILAELRRAADRLGTRAVAVTFDPHPRAVLCPEAAPPLLLPLAWRVRYLRAYGADEVAVLPFDAELAALSPEAFLDRLAATGPVRALAVGRDWRFGRHGAGDADFLADAGSRRGFEFLPVDEMACHGVRIGSTAIRKYAAAGQLTAAAAMLGRDYALYGRVGGGFQAAGKELGHPTANLELSAGVPPPDGVYAGRCLGRPAAVNIGVSPTYGHQNHNRRRVEVHLLDFDGDLYGRELEVELRQFLREERTFPGPVELRRQIEADVAAIRRLAEV